MGQGSSQAAAVPLWAQAFSCCTLSQVFRKTWLSYVCRLFARGADVTSLPLNPSSLAIMKQWLLSVSMSGCEYLVGLRFQNMHHKQTLF